MIELPQLPNDLPWKKPAYLLLDGVSVPNLAQRLFQWDNLACCLYQSTRWQDLSDISPYLIKLKGANDPLLAYFREHAHLEWGYLLFSDADVHTLWGHWRHLLSVEHTSGIEVMPRIADPAVMHQLFGLAEQIPSARWFGPVEHVCLPDGIEGVWQQHKRTASVNSEPETYRLTDQELTALGEVEFRNFVSGLNEHLQTYFPEFMATFAESERRRYAQKVADDAYGQGFSSEQEITLYANVFGYLAGQPVTEHPDIVQLLMESTSQEPLKRLERAAALAENRAANRQGSLL
ncbi:DUF4123 domain-containing protein [Pseudomonas lijiangensis]|uniref:DUF4123 domain-containing protein n=1 Tax=Pseudomonas lijiangensis TaxID=2995658 RepID=A0ABX8HU36_9PSED|nr:MULTISPECIES: DUF4123 domain-containing protein [Pseudomonas syringae group]MBX8503125.1 DUF4123 domain-containing protein [Pseudomonas lijiangensis]MBX8508028.1 DUF4123 domain-containing protein [Pseudomonas lijiangensis]MBX8558072.1 DUF4123 domain-containing protein [Pseudomonas cichorii]QWU84091.1 DUF4123 domain-containing protein [Pseudomonas lijiangensis]